MTRVTRTSQRQPTIPTAPLIAFQLEGGYASSIYQTGGSRSFVQLGATIPFEQGDLRGMVAVTAFESFNRGLDLGAPVLATYEERRPFAFEGANTTADAALR